MWQAVVLRPLYIYRAGNYEREYNENTKAVLDLDEDTVVAIDRITY